MSPASNTESPEWIDQEAPPPEDRLTHFENKEACVDNCHSPAKRKRDYEKPAAELESEDLENEETVENNGQEPAAELESERAGKIART
jgi:hypothetical protein